MTKLTEKQLLKRIEELEKKQNNQKDLATASSVMTESLKAMALFGAVYAVCGGFNR